MDYKINQSVTLETLECCSCGVVFAMPGDMMRRRRDDHQAFYCPSGHANYYSGSSDKEVLREQLDRAESERNEARERADDVSRSYQRVRKRIRNGVCP